MLEEIKVMVIERIASKRREVTTWASNFSVVAMKKLEKTKENSYDRMMDWNESLGMCCCPKSDNRNFVRCEGSGVTGYCLEVMSTS